MKKMFLISLLLSALPYSTNAKDFSIASPDGKLVATVTVNGKITYRLFHQSDLLIESSPVAMKLVSGEVWGYNPQIENSQNSSKNETITSPFSKNTTVLNHYNELLIRFKGNWALKFRIYNDGLAYRFLSNRKDAYSIESEESGFLFPADYKAYVPYVKEDYSRRDPLQSSFENVYTYAPLSELDNRRLIFLPVLIEASNGKKVCITEADLESFPGMYLQKASEGLALKGIFARYPSKTQQGGHNMLQQQVLEREPFIAKVHGAKEFPWRVAIVSSSDKELAVSDMSYKLASPSRVADISWIKPGKVAWEWWNDWNIFGVDFKAGINNKTYKHYIDFASQHGIEYIILDEGWAVNKQADLMQVVPEIDLRELVAYGNERNVGIILWAGYWAFDRDMENVCRHYAQMGIKGFKVDFMDRDDQPMVEFIYRASETAARYKLVLDFHGMYKPAGLQRTYPNVLNFEGVNGLEQVKWADESMDLVTYDAIIPFIRMVSGPMDYTQGAMRNASRGNYRPVYSDPMSQGTRCRQLALYVVFESPLNMLCDSPSEYTKEPESLQFIANIPTVWDQSVALNGEVGRYITLARRKGKDWYIGGITNWDERTIEVDLSFLPKGKYRATIFQDGENAHRKGTDYRKREVEVSSLESISVHLAPGGGFAIKLNKLD